MVHDIDVVLVLLLTHDGLLTQGAHRLTRFNERTKAGAVKAMTARQKLRWLPRRVKRIEADRAICESRVARTGVLGKDRGLDADPAFVAVRVGFLTADATDSALVTVELALVDVVEEDTLRTPIGAESDAAGGANLICILNGVASHTLDRLHGLPV